MSLLLSCWRYCVPSFPIVLVLYIPNSRVRSSCFSLFVISVSTPALLPAAPRRLFLVSLFIGIYIYRCTPPSFPPFWLCRLLLPRTVVWVCSGSQKKRAYGGLRACSVRHGSRRLGDLRRLICVFLFSYSVDYLVKTVSALGPLYMCARRFYCCWLGHNVRTVPFLRCVPVLAHYMIIACRYFYVFPFFFLFLFLSAFSKMAVGI